MPKAPAPALSPMDRLLDPAFLKANARNVRAVSPDGDHDPNRIQFSLKTEDGEVFRLVYRREGQDWVRTLAIYVEDAPYWTGIDRDRAFEAWNVLDHLAFQARSAEADDRRDRACSLVERLSA